MSNYKRTVHQYGKIQSRCNNVCSPKLSNCCGRHSAKFSLKLVKVDMEKKTRDKNLILNVFVFYGKGYERIWYFMSAEWWEHGIIRQGDASTQCWEQAEGVTSLNSNAHLCQKCHTTTRLFSPLPSWGLGSKRSLTCMFIQLRIWSLKRVASHRAILK